MRLRSHRIVMLYWPGRNDCEAVKRGDWRCMPDTCGRRRATHAAIVRFHDEPGTSYVPVCSRHARCKRLRVAITTLERRRGGVDLVPSIEEVKVVRVFDMREEK